MSRHSTALLIFATSGVLTIGNAVEGSAARITAAAELRGLSPRDLEQPLQVTMRGIVTYVDPTECALFIQDNSGGAILRFPGEPGFRAGDLLETTGMVTLLNGVPGVKVAETRTTGHRALPAPIPLVTDILMTGKYEGQLIAVEGIVWSSGVAENKLRLRLGLAAGLIKLDVVGPATTPTVPVDAHVLVQGVLARMVNHNGQLVGFRVLVPDINMIAVVSPAPADPFATPAKSIDRLVRLTPDATGGHRVKIAGVVTRHNRGTSVFLRDATGAFHAHTSQDLPLSPGTRIEAIGFLSPPDPDEYSPFLENAIVRIVGSGPEPRPTIVTASSILSGDHDGDLAQLDGRVVDVLRRRASYQVMLRADDGTVFHVQVPSHERVGMLDDLRYGSDMRVVGTVSINANNRTQPIGFVLRARSAEDFVVLRTAAGRWPVRYFVWALGGILTIGVAAAVWIAMLRRQVRRQTAMVRQRLDEEAALKKRYQELFENANDAILIVAPDFALTAANRTADALIAGGPQDGLFGSITDLVSPEMRSSTVEHLVAARDGISSTFRSEIVSRSGRRVPVEISARAILRDELVVGLQCIVRDLSEREQMEDQLRQAQKMEAVGQLAGGIAHDFNNLITVMLGHAEMIQMQPDARDVVASAAEEIRIASERAAGLTQQLLAFSRRQHLSPKVLNLNEVIGHMSRLIRTLTGERYELQVHLGNELARIKADPNQICQILINLTANARDAMAGGGVLRIETTNLRLRRPGTGHDGVIPAGTYVVLSVTDKGCGMTDDVRARIFEPFFTTKEIGKGTGLGLATVYGIVKQSGAFIDVVSRPGVGTTFRVYFPHVSEERAGDAASQRPIVDSPAHETVMLVEDELPLRKLVARALEEKGYRVVTAGDGREALDLMEGLDELPDLLISDVVMPQIGGCELAERVSARRPETKVLLMTGYSEPSILDSAVGSGHTLMIKPFKLDELLQKTRELLDDAPAAA